ncbi:hypothetical protein ACK317_01775 [Aeromonas dhakensis]|uniref:hypothetical protein n=1 Tax=Aeromonas TaxID=642 RepID=UPI0018A772F2|nr:hypothetical protein [Aeromonas dhakensis]MBF8449564.1 hypothetical protein [Aeromonas dhakensis]MCJ2369556.1 hypothetical protein [Aeromonas dhakensis]HDZ8844650.1 hypothetical protein [Aeromonas dhakensis]
MRSKVYDIIKSAIANKQQVFATYDGRHREMCPHVIGTKNGVEQALFFQFGGDSSKGAITTDTKDNWRCVTLAKLSDVTVKDGEWHTFGNHSMPSTCIDVIDLQVEF